jgi:tight adherence protein B
MFHQALGHKILLIALALELLGGFLLYRLAKSL